MMNKFGKASGTQILASVQPSFIGHGGKVGEQVSATSNVAFEPPDVSTSRRDSGYTEGEQIELKPWEEVLTRRLSVSDRKTSYVRLPGPRLRDEEAEQELQEREVRAKEIVNYLKDKWDIDIDKKSSLVEVKTRTLEMLLHQRPSNYAILKRARMDIAERTGFFSDVTRPYECLGVPELDNDMLTFRNLPDSVKISPDEWLEVQLRRQQEKDKRNARLPRLPKSGLMSKRTNYARGRIKQNAGGMDSVERLIHDGEIFQREIRGPMTFTRLLESWFQMKEEETANRGSPFGQLKRSKLEAPSEVIDLTGSKADDGYSRDDNGHAVGVDEKVYQEYMNLEKMMIAIYNLVKSMINIKIKQLKSQNRIPFSGVIELRSKSPQGTRRRNLRPPIEMLDKFSKNTGVYAALARGMAGKTKTSSDTPTIIESESEFESIRMSSTDHRSIHKKPKFKLSNAKSHTAFQFHGTGRHPFGTWNPTIVAEIYPLGSTEELKAAVERVHKITESPSYLDDRPYELRSATLRKERPMLQAERIRRHNDRFRAMFQRHEKAPEPIWWNVHVRGLQADKEAKKKDSAKEIPLKSAGEIKSNTALPIPWTAKIPDPDDIHTPELPGRISVEKLNSEEQSRLNLLATVPNAAEDQHLNSPMRKLYEASGIKSTEKDFFQTLMNIKRSFRALEKSLRVNVTNEVEKFEWDTPKRYQAKIYADCVGPIYEKSIGTMRQLYKQAAKKEMEAIENNLDQTDPKDKKPAPWFRDLIDMCDRIRALKHQGCSNIVHKLVRYSDVNSNSKPHMLRRFCLLVVSLPANEIAAPHFQKAIQFLLDKLFGAPVELLEEWLQYAKIPLLI